MGGVPSMEKACQAGETTFTRKVKDLKTVEYAKIGDFCQGPFIPVRFDEGDRMNYGIFLPQTGETVWCTSGEQTLVDCVKSASTPTIPNSTPAK
jgi:hypothetical protein